MALTAAVYGWFRLPETRSSGVDDATTAPRDTSPRAVLRFAMSRDLVAVDMEIFKRAGFAFCPSMCVRRTIEQAYGGTAPSYTVAGDTDTAFADLVPWENIPDRTVELIDRAEEVYVAWGFINLKAGSEHVDFKMFPPKNVFYRMMVGLMRVLYRIVAHFGLFDRFFGRR